MRKKTPEYHMLTPRGEIHRRGFFIAHYFFSLLMYIRRNVCRCQSLQHLPDASKHQHYKWHLISAYTKARKKKHTHTHRNDKVNIFFVDGIGVSVYMRILSDTHIVGSSYLRGGFVEVKKTLMHVKIAMLHR